MAIDKESRLDIVMTFGHTCVAIENKIRAGDRHRQLERYHAYASKWHSSQGDLPYVAWRRPGRGLARMLAAGSGQVRFLRNGCACLAGRLHQGSRSPSADPGDPRALPGVAAESDGQVDGRTGHGPTGVAGAKAGRHLQLRAGAEDRGGDDRVQHRDGMEVLADIEGEAVEGRRTILAAGGNRRGSSSVESTQGGRPRDYQPRAHWHEEQVEIRLDVPCGVRRRARAIPELSAWK